MKYEIAYVDILNGFIRLRITEYYNSRVFTGDANTIDAMFFCHVEPVKIIGSWHCFGDMQRTRNGCVMV